MYFLGNQPLKQSATVWSQMPNEFRKRAKSTAWAQANKAGAAIDSFLEGPVFDAHGNLYVTDIPFGRVFKIDPKGLWTLLIEYDGEPNGMKWLRAGVLLITDYRNGLMQLDIAQGQISRYLDRRNSESFKGVNDLTFDSKGNLYFTDQGQTGLHDPTGRVFRLATDGQLTLLLNNVPSPNGVVLSPDEKVMYVGVTRANEVWRAPLLPDGSVTKVGRFFASHGPSGPDGLAMDIEGNLVVANPGLGCVWLINHRGEPIGVWESPTGAALTNIAFGGKEGRTLFCTESESGSILTAELPFAGLKVCMGS